MLLINITGNHVSIASKIWASEIITVAENIHFFSIVSKSVYSGSLGGIFSRDYEKKYRKEIDRFA